MNKQLTFISLSILLLAAACNSEAPSKKNQYPFQDRSLSMEERAADLVGRLSLEEKVAQMFNDAPAIERLGIPAYNWWNECLHGVARAGRATVFPQAIGLAATFDEDLMLRVASVISDEGRAKHHAFSREGITSIYTGLTFWSPNINIFRDPRWGRGQETYGEDPYLTGRMAVNFVNGIQGGDEKYLKAVATVKHYAVHSGPEASRHSDDYYTSDADLHNTYLAAFEMAVREADVQSLMCAYNRFRAEPCCGNDPLLQEILREQFGFGGYIVSDCGAIADFYLENNHHVVETPEEASAWAVRSGTDLNCGATEGNTFSSLVKAVEEGLIQEAEIDRAVTRLFLARFRLGMFDPEEEVPFAGIPMSVLGSEQHLDLSLEAARKSLVLLKNDAVLPLKKDARIALIGPNADNLNVLVGNYFGQPVRPMTPRRAFTENKEGVSAGYAPGSPLAGSYLTHHEVVKSSCLFHRRNDGTLEPGLQGNYFETTDFSGKAKLSRVDTTIDFNWEKSPINGLLEEEFSVEWSGILIPGESGTFQFESGGLELAIDGKAGNEFELVKGQEYEIYLKQRFEHIWYSNTISPQVSLKWLNGSRDLEQEALELAGKSDVIVFCGGISPQLEGEEMPLELDGFSHGDRTHLDLPAVQEELLKKLHALGKPIVYVNFSGSALSLNWEQSNLPAIVQAFYPGEAAGTALWQLLYGEFSPSGRLPVTYYKSVEDLPGFKDYAMANRTYRYFRGEVLYPFGYGLSYTTFAYDDLQIRSLDKGVYQLEFELGNTGDRTGEEVVQLYVQGPASDGVLRELKGFKRLSLDPGERVRVSMLLDESQLERFDQAAGKKLLLPGDYALQVGSSSADIKLTSTITVKQD